ncbi:MAG: cobalamin B12-binding domain-containing protein [Enterobacterales bacterium]|nr:cobalamin B12-binding domain-containing protein [Enterobacterales bacterium]
MTHSHTDSLSIYKAKHKIRMVTAASLFDGHDAAINIMRRIIQATGCEVIHLGHNRSVQEVVNCAIQEDVQAIAMTSYQGGHVEYLKYMVDLLAEAHCSHIQVFAGGGGVILPTEIKELEAYGVARIFTPDDGRTMGLQGMINDLVKRSDFATGDLTEKRNNIAAVPQVHQQREIGKLISAAENFSEASKKKLT